MQLWHSHCVDPERGFHTSLILMTAVGCDDVCWGFAEVPVACKSEARIALGLDACFAAC